MSRRANEDPVGRSHRPRGIGRTEHASGTTQHVGWEKKIKKPWREASVRSRGQVGACTSIGVAGWPSVLEADRWEALHCLVGDFAKKHILNNHRHPSQWQIPLNAKPELRMNGTYRSGSKRSASGRHRRATVQCPASAFFHSHSQRRADSFWIQVSPISLKAGASPQIRFRKCGQNSPWEL